MSELIRLAPTTGLNLFKECPRCFWLRFNKEVFRPRGIFPSLPSGMDSVIRRYFDSFRSQNKLPPELEGRVVGTLMSDIQLLNQWRDWKSGALEHEYKELGVVLLGALDDCLVNGEYYIPIDYKTRGWAPKQGQSEQYYQTQLDAYCLLLSEKGYKTQGFAYLVYYFPKQVGENTKIDFATEVVRVQTDIDRAKNTLEKAVNALKGPLPVKHPDCEYCNWINNRLEFE